MTLAVRNRVSRRDTTELTRELFGVGLATGSVDAIVQRAGEALAAPHTRLEQEIKAASVVNIDETGWKTAGSSRTLWGTLSARAAVFRIAAGRHAFEARTLLGERFAGIVCSDRWRGYDYLDPGRRQLCWAHLLRDFTAHSEGMAEQKKFGDDGVQIAHDLVNAWRAYQQDCDRARLQAQIAPLQAKLRALLEHAARKSPKTKYHRLFAKSLLKRWPALRTFAHTDGVEPTNNHAERGLRGAACRDARSSPTSPTSSAPTSAATPSPRSPDQRGLNAYGFSSSRGWVADGGATAWQPPGNLLRPSAVAHELLKRLRALLPVPVRLHIVRLMDTDGVACHRRRSVAGNACGRVSGRDGTAENLRRYMPELGGGSCIPDAPPEVVPVKRAASLRGEDEVIVIAEAAAAFVRLKRLK